MKKRVQTEDEIEPSTICRQMRMLAPNGKRHKLRAKMKNKIIVKNPNCSFCNLSVEDKKYQLYENDFWIVFMADKQDYLGRCLVMSKRHIETIHDVTTDEWLSLQNVIGSIEELVKNEFGADLINWSCLMNDAYKSDMPCPHLHFHIRPRYSRVVKMFGCEFRDKEFAHHYDNKKEDVSDDVKQKIFEYMEECAVRYF